MQELEAEVAIIGGGIGGATLALALGRAGREVLVLERERTPPAATRPELLWPLTLARLDRLGMGSEFRREAALPLDGVSLYYTKEPLLTLQDQDVEAAGVRPWSTDAAATRALLLQAALETGRVRVERGVTVRHLVREDGRVAGAEAERDGAAVTVRARLTVGDDGVRSVVRQDAGLPMTTTPFPLEFLTTVAPLPPGFTADHARGYIGPGAGGDSVLLALFIPIPGDRVAVVVALPGRDTAGLSDADRSWFWEPLAAATPLADALREHRSYPEDWTHVRRAFGHAERYVTDGAAILGDAAHPMSPAGGQGANAAIWDALALAETADRALRRGACDFAALMPYEERRRPANHRSLAFSRGATRAFHLFSALPWLADLAVGSVRFLGGFAAPRRGLLRLLGTAYADDTETFEAAEEQTLDV